MTRFQCSSASRKFLKITSADSPLLIRSFSALQRAENSSTGVAPCVACGPRTFQCSSASRKFLKVPVIRGIVGLSSFSALQRAENSSTDAPGRWRSRRIVFQCSSASRKFLNQRRPPGAPQRHAVSVLFSEPKIPQHNYDYDTDSEDVVSVLFSEPKIPQRRPAARRVPTTRRFSALQRAENSSM